MSVFINIMEKIPKNDFYLWLLVSFISCIIFSLVNIFLFTHLFRVETTFKKKFLAVMVNSVIRFIFSLFLSIPCYRILNIITTVITFKIIFKQNIEKCLVSEVISLITYISFEVIFSKLFCMLFSDVNTYAEGIYNLRYKFWLMFSICTCRFIVCLILKKKNIRIYINDDLSKKNRNKIIGVTIIGCMIIILNTIAMAFYIKDLPYSLFLLNTFSLILYFFISMKTLIQTTVLEEQNLTINNLQSYNNTLTIMYDNIRCFKHDFFNFVQALDGYVKTNNIEGIKQMTTSIHKECREVNDMGILDPKIINNPAVYSIITNKYYSAQEKGISVHLEVNMDLNKLNISNYDFCRILAILLDNAIEAAQKSKEKIINIRFTNDKKYRRKVVTIENSYNNPDIDFDKLFDKGYSFKKCKKHEHGLGLWIVKRILLKHDNLNLYTNIEEYFCQQLEIYKDGIK